MQNICLSNLTITHNELRSKESLKYWERYLRFNEKVNEIIFLSKMEDGELYLHDGLHRATAIYISGRQFLFPEEYRIRDMTYKMYDSINREIDYLTPFDIKNECRLSFWHIKDQLREMSDEEIRQNKHLYCEPRTKWIIKELL